MAVDPLGPIEIVCVADGNVDPAVDVEASNLDEYMRTRNPVHLRFKTGIAPTRFTVRPIKASYVLDKLENMPRGSKAFLAFASSCHLITLPDGSTLKPSRVNADPIYQVDVADSDWIDKVSARCRLAAVMEVGLFAVRRASLNASDLGPFDWSPGSTPTP